MKQPLYTANTKAQAIQAVTEKLIDICLLDLRIGEDDGIDVLQAIKRISRKTIVIMMTAYGTIENTVHAMRAGAYNYLIKPLNITELNLALENACSYLKLHQKVEYLQSELENCVSRGGIIGKSPAMREVFHMVDKIKDSKQHRQKRISLFCQAVFHTRRDLGIFRPLQQSLTLHLFQCAA